MHNKKIIATIIGGAAIAAFGSMPVNAAPSPTTKTTAVMPVSEAEATATTTDPTDSIDLSMFSSKEKAAAAAAILASDEVCIGYAPENVTEPEEQAKISTVVEAFQKVPRSVQKFLGSKHVGIVMEDPAATGLKAYMHGEEEEVSNHVVGLWLPECRGISVGYNSADVVTCHEVGHAFDEYTGLSKTEQWEALYASEAGALQSSGSQNYANSAEEFFGEAFNQYCLRKELLRQTCPGVYAYIDAAVAAIA